MDNWITISDKFNNLPDAVAIQIGDRKSIDCQKHGTTEALINGKCRACLCDEEKQIAFNNLKLSVEKWKILSNIKTRFINAEFDNYLINSPYQQEVVDQIKNWHGNGNILMVGNPGCGKTHLAIAKITQNLWQRKTAYYSKYYELNDISINDKNLYKSIRNVDLLVIDEYGRSVSDYKSNLLFEIIDHRYDCMLSTIIISNLTLTDLANSLDDSLYSRLKENCAVCTFDWEDYRLNRDKTSQRVV